MGREDERGSEGRGREGRGGASPPIFWHRTALVIPALKHYEGLSCKFNRADYSDGSTAAAATTTTGGQHKTVSAVDPTVSADRCAERTTSNRREYVLSDHRRHTETGTYAYKGGFHSTRTELN